MNYQEIYNRFKLKIDGNNNLTKAEKLTAKSTLMLCLWEQASTDVVLAQHSRDEIGEQKLKLIAEIELKKTVDQVIDADKPSNGRYKKIIILGKQGSGKSVLAQKISGSSIHGEWVQTYEINEGVSDEVEMKMLLTDNCNRVITSNYFIKSDFNTHREGISIIELSTIN